MVGSQDEISTSDNQMIYTKALLYIFKTLPETPTLSKCETKNSFEHLRAKHCSMQTSLFHTISHNLALFHTVSHYNLKHCDKHEILQVQSHTIIVIGIFILC